MPQLDKVTLFSQVFWLLFLYFSFFLILLKYFLPIFSKLFKVRAHYILNKQSLKSNSFQESIQSSQILIILEKFEREVKNNLTDLQNFYFTALQTYESSFFKDVNKLFISLFIKSCLNLNFFKRLYL